MKKTNKSKVKPKLPTQFAFIPKKGFGGTFDTTSGLTDDNTLAFNQLADSAYKQGSISNGKSSTNGLSSAASTGINAGLSAVGSVANAITSAQPQSNYSSYLPGRSDADTIVDSLVSLVPVVGQIYGIGSAIGDLAKTDYQEQDEYGKLEDRGKYIVADGIGTILNPLESFISGLSGEGWTPVQRANKIDEKGNVNYNRVLNAKRNKMLNEYMGANGNLTNPTPMAQGGPIRPIVVNDKNDPRLKAYQDSLNAYNFTDVADKRFIKRAGDMLYAYDKYDVSTSDAIKHFGKELYDEVKGKFEPVGGIEYRSYLMPHPKLEDKDLPYTKLILKYKKPVQPVIYEEVPINKIQRKEEPIATSDINRGLKSITMGGTEVDTNYPQVKVRYNKKGNPIFWENSAGQRIPYGDKEQLTKQFAYPKMAMGGPIVTTYGTGGTHEQNPNGGIPVDAMGNPSIVSKQQPVASTEEGEVTWLNPKTKQIYVFSNRIR